jgi:hypothetical protein
MDSFEAVDLSEVSSLAEKKYFSPEEANRALALVRRIVADIVQDYRRVRQLYERCQALDARGKAAEAEEARHQYLAISDRLSELNEELDQVGCELKDYHIGLVDFPARLHGREVCLCWKLGEPGIETWHDVHAGFAGRQPIAEQLFD